MSPPEPLALIDVLRCRRELAASEVVELLAELPAMLDEVTKRPPHLLRMVRAGFPVGAPVAALAMKPVSSWPPFRLFWQEEVEDGGTTVYGATRPPPDAPAQLAGLLYELLGGRRRDRLDTAFSPLAGLNEAGNTVLRRALAGGAFSDCRAFWKRWVETLETEVVTPPPAWRVPAAPRGAAEPATVLELLPQGTSQPPVWLVARETFRIGRSRVHADWPTRGPSDTDVPPGVSRMQATGKWLADGPAFRDGGEGGPSTNGTTLNGVPLSAEKLRPLRGGGIFTFGGEYRLEAWRMPEGASGPESDVSARRGAVVFQELDGRMLLREAVWLGSEVAFRISAAGRFHWDRGRAGGEIAWFVHRRGEFWIANGGLGGLPVRVASILVEAGEMAPLPSGHDVEVGSLCFKIAKIE